MASPRFGRNANWLILLVLVPLLGAGACTRQPDEVGAGPQVAPSPREAPQPVIAAPPPESVPAAPAAAAPAPAPLPGTPEAPRVTAQSRSEIAVSWQPPAGANVSLAYELFRGSVRVLRTGDTRVINGDLKPGTRYCYSIVAIDPDGRASPASAPACVQTLDTDGPTPPRDVKVAVRGGSAAELSWTPSTDDVGVSAYEVFRGEVRVASVRVATVREDGLTPGKELCWTIRAVDAAGNRSAGSDPACATIPDTTPPTVPGAVTASAPGERTVDLAWRASQDDVGVARYEVLREGAPVLAASTPAAREQGLAPARRYCFSVRACDAAGNCSAPSPETCATTPDLTPPTSPSPFDALPRSDVAVELAWAPSTDEVGVVGYEVTRGDKVLAAAHPGASFTDGGLRPATKYCYSLLALDAAGNRSAAKRACATTLDLTPPSQPGRAGAVSVSSSQLFLGWDPSSDDVGVAGYEVLRNGKVIATVTVTHVRERSLPANTEGCYTVRAFDAYGNRSQPAGPVCARTADPSQLASPSDLKAVRLSSTEVLLRWEPSEQEGVYYRIYENGMKSAGLTRSNTFNPSGRMGARADCYRVAAVDDQNRESPPSNEACTTAVAPVVTQR